MVIVGYDGLGPSHDALALGAALAPEGDRVMAVMVNQKDQRSTPTDPALARARYQQRQALRSDVLARRPTPPGSPDVEVVLESGWSAAEGLLAVADPYGSPTVVVGSPHRGPAGRVLMGSTCGSLLASHRHVVAVAPRGLALMDHAIATIGVGMDGSPASARALEAATELAPALGARVVGLTAAHEDGPHLGSLTAGEGEQIDVLRLEGDPAPALVRAAADVDLLVVAARAGNHVLGSVSARLAHECPAPLLVVPERARS